jgi:hypothetical protein
MSIKTHRQKARVKTREQNCSLPENSRRDGGSITAAKLLKNKDDDQETKSEKTAPDFRVFPWIGCPTPLESKEQTDDSTYEEECTKKIDF